MHKELSLHPGEAAGRPRLHVALAQSEAEVREAQRLRYKVFVEEFGARLQTRLPDHDVDFYDAYCEHLIVRDLSRGRVIGTYRILAPEAAARVGGYYSENEFCLTRLQHLRSRTVEIGRSCVHQDYRSGGVIALLWSGLADYMLASGHDYLIGCASIGMGDGGHNAANLYRELQASHLAPVEYRVFPLHPLPVDRLGNDQKADQKAHVPPLLKGYLRAGAWICGEPAWDPDFNSADLLVMLPMVRLKQRYARHFLGEAAEAQVA